MHPKIPFQRNSNRLGGSDPNIFGPQNAIAVLDSSVHIMGYWSGKMLTLGKGKPKDEILNCGSGSGVRCFCLSKKLDVKITDRQDKEDGYDYAAVYNNVAVGKSFKVRGAMFTWKFRWPTSSCQLQGNCGTLRWSRLESRSCRMPIVDSIQADFDGDNAKLIGPVSLDGKTMQSETYKILGILDKPKSDQD